MLFGIVHDGDETCPELRSLQLYDTNTISHVHNIPGIGSTSQRLCLTFEYFHDGQISRSGKSIGASLNKRELDVFELISSPLQRFGNVYGCAFMD
eukprot:5541279-Amphidinium_carterae.1